MASGVVARLRVILGGDDKDLSRTYGRARKNTSRFAKDTESAMTRSFARIGAALGTAFVGIAGFRALKSQFSESIKLAGIQEQAISALNTTLKNSGQFSEAYSESLQTMASKFQGVTTFGDEAILGVQNFLIQMGAGPEVINRATQATLNFAAATGRDLKTAQELVGKAIAGQFGTLSRYGILVDAGASNSEKLQQALGEIEKKFGGQAEAKAKTYAGRMEQIANAYGDAQEKAGFLITRSDFLSDAFAGLTQVIAGVDESIDGVKQSDFDDFLRGVSLATLDSVAAVASLAQGIVGFVETLTSPVVALAVAAFNDDIDLSDVLAADKSGLDTLSGSIGAALERAAELREKIDSAGRDEGAVKAADKVDKLRERAKAAADEVARTGKGLEDLGPQAAAGAGAAAEALDKVRAAGSRGGGGGDAETEKRKFDTRHTPGGGLHQDRTTSDLGGGASFEFFFERIRQFRDAADAAISRNDGGALGRLKRQLTDFRTDNGLIFNGSNPNVKHALGPGSPFIPHVADYREIFADVERGQAAAHSAAIEAAAATSRGSAAVVASVDRLAGALTSDRFAYQVGNAVARVASTSTGRVSFGI